MIAHQQCLEVERVALNALSVRVPALQTRVWRASRVTFVR